MPVIDCHVHLYPPELNAAPEAWAAARGERHWATLCTRRRRDGRPVQGFPTVGDLLRDLDRAAIDRAVLLGWYWEQPETCAWHNRFLASCVRAHPDRLDAFATVHAGAGREVCLAEMARAREEGLKGLGELCPPAQGYSYTEETLRDVLRQAAAWGWPVNLHVTDPSGRAYPGRIETPLDEVRALVRSHPGTPFILAHWGGSLAFGWSGDETQPDNVYFDTAASPLLYGVEVWARELPRVGAGRVLFGSDYPLHLYPRNEEQDGLGRFVAEARAGGAEAAVFGGNLRRLLEGVR
ncbi:MAG: amidohydrolase [Verrucomicrobia bacterium]|nr:amidohydrolase [Verrucomicrobiota bacterium]